MSIAITSATSGSSTNRCTTSAPHQRATPVTRTLLFLATLNQSTQRCSGGRVHPAAAMYERLQIVASSGYSEKSDRIPEWEQRLRRSRTRDEGKPSGFPSYI